MILKPQSKTLEAILSSTELPTLPLIASKLLIITAHDDASLTDIANLVSQDVALSTKILRVVNSSFYSFSQQISSINQAVTILGINAVRSLVLTFSFFSFYTKKRIYHFNFEKFWEQSLVHAVAAKLILEQITDKNTEEIFTCGLLQNIGKLICAITLPNEYNDFLEKIHHLKNAEKQSKDYEENDIALETKFIGISHDIIGYEVAKIWRLPENIFISIRYHHDPTQYHGNNQSYQRDINIIYLSHLISCIFYSDTPGYYHKKFRTDSKKILGFSQEKIDRILNKINKDIEESALFFGLKINNSKPIEDILQEANLRLSVLNLSYEEMNRELIKSKIELEKVTEELKKKNKLLENQVNIDGLTEISNHRFFQNFLDAELKRSIKKNLSISLLLADIDHFKKINDTYGHQVGDFLLKEFCRITKTIIRQDDLIARYGGEEFAFILPETSSEESLRIAEEIRKTIDNYIFDDGENSYHFTISIGVVSVFPAKENFTKNDLINCSDMALYEAKKSGRNKVVLYQQKKKKIWF